VQVSSFFLASLEVLVFYFLLAADFELLRSRTSDRYAFDVWNRRVSLLVSAIDGESNSKRRQDHWPRDLILQMDVPLAEIVSLAPYWVNRRRSQYSRTETLVSIGWSVLELLWLFACELLQISLFLFF